MKLRLILFWSAVAVTVGLLAFDLSVRVRIQRLQSAETALLTRYTTLNRELQAETRKAAAQHQLSVAQATARLAASSPGGAAGAESSGGRPTVDVARVIALSPELRSQYLQAIRSGAAARWPLLFQVLNLPPGENEKFGDLMAQRIANNLQVDEIATERGLDPSDPAMKKLAGQLNRQNENAIAALLGPDTYATFQQYSRENGVAPVLQDFAGNLPGAPLALDQAEQLSHVMAAASQIDKYGYATYGTIDIDQVMNRAVGILTPDQLPTLAAVLQKNRAYVQSTKLAPPP
jgi:hypothetical protein